MLALEAGSADSFAFERESRFEIRESGRQLTVRLSDFPEEPMYTLLLDAQPLTSFDDWPPGEWAEQSGRPQALLSGSG